jgi:hypothetical protein
MGNALCLSQREKKSPEQYATAARVSPIPTFRKRRRPSGADAPSSLQDLCVAVVAANAAGLDISVLPSELIQRVADHLVDEGEGAATRGGAKRPDLKLPGHCSELGANHEARARRPPAPRTPRARLAAGAALAGSTALTRP